MTEQRYQEISRIWENFNLHERKKLPYSVFWTISEDGLLLECDEDWQGKAMRFMRENPSVTRQELREWAASKEKERTEAMEQADR